MSKTFRPYEPDQIFLMPTSMRDWLPADHLAYFISDVVEQLDLSVIMQRYRGEERGYPPYHPVMMVKVLLYAYCVGVPSSRKIAKRLEEDIAFRVLAANNTPDFRTISDFRKDHLKALSGLFLQVLKLCRKAGLVKPGAYIARRHQDQGERFQTRGRAGEERRPAAAVPPDKTQRNFTDADLHTMPAPGGKHFEQAYNAQAAEDSAHQVGSGGRDHR